jgi:hypothetical protein
MITRNYKTLKGLIAQTRDGRLTLHNFIAGAIYTKKRKWVRFQLSDEARTQIVNLFAKTIDLRKKDDLYNLYKSCGLCERLWIDLDGRATYCAGQSWPDETKWLRQHIHQFS